MWRLGVNAKRMVCKNCSQDAVIIDRSEGTYVCTECGVVQEYNIINEEYYEFETSNIDLYFDIDNELDRSIPSYIWKEANDLFTTIQMDHSYRGNIKKGVYCNCLYSICHLYNLPRSIKEIGEIMEVDSCIITKTTKHVDAYYGTSSSSRPDSTSNSSNPIVLIMDDDFAKMIPRYLMKLDLMYKWETIKLTQAIHDYYSNRNLLKGRAPHTKLVTFIYHHLVLENGKSSTIHTKREICSMFDISVVTLNKSYKQLLCDLV